MPHEAILVAGGAGYIGAQTCKALAAEGYIPVTLDIDAPETITVAPVAYPAPQPLQFAWLDEHLPSYAGTFTVHTALIFAEQREDVTITAMLRFQACTDTECFIPQRLTFALPLQFRPFTP
jgi:nucleoside-diphosphate-sugar epimerase